MKCVSYESISFDPVIIAKCVCFQTYTGQEFSDQIRSTDQVAKIEKKRRAMSADEVEEFAKLADERCRLAFDAKNKWFMNCVKSKTNTGRDQMYLWIAHWLASYLDNTERFRRNYKGVNK